jgi:hypothetical protein
MTEEEKSKKMQDYSNLCATFGDLKIRIYQIEGELNALKEDAELLKQKLINDRKKI